MKSTFSSDENFFRPRLLSIGPWKVFDVAFSVMIARTMVDPFSSDTERRNYGSVRIEINKIEIICDA